MRWTFLCISVPVDRLFLIYSFTKSAAIGGSWLTRCKGRSQVQLFVQASFFPPCIGVKTPSISFLMLLRAQLLVDSARELCLLFTVELWRLSILSFYNHCCAFKSMCAVFYPVWLSILSTKTPILSI